MRADRFDSTVVAAIGVILIAGCTSAPKTPPEVYCINVPGAPAAPREAPTQPGKPAARTETPASKPHPAPPAAKASPSIPTPPASGLPQAFSFDLNRYMGRWYVIANIPYWAENGNVGAYVEYRRRDDGDIDDLYFYHPRNFDTPLEEKKGRAYVVAGSGGTQWRVTFLWPIYVDYQVLYVDPDYRYALVGYPDKSLGWVFSREPEIDAATYRSLLAKFATLGYDVSKFKRIPQTPAQMNLPGFQ